jgi:DNA adenine methylase
MGLFDELDAMTEDVPILKAPFWYAGGKGRSLSNLLPNIPYGDVYVEPFGGSASVLLSRRKSKLEVFNDRYSGVTDFYRVIRDPRLWQQLQERMELTVHSREEWFHCKDTWQNVQDPVERAARWYYMLFYSFGSLGRNFGRSLGGSGSLSGKIRDKLSLFPTIHDRFRNVQVENGDWEVVCKTYDSHSTVQYLDPPYVDAYKGTYKNEMTIDAHRHMLDWIKTAKSTVCVSGYSNPLYEAFPWDKRLTWEVAMSIDSGALEGNGKEQDNGRGKATEVLWIKYSNE